MAFYGHRVQITREGPMARLPENSIKTCPLKAAALADLRWLVKGPQPRQEINPGVANHLDREHLVETVMLPSPYKTPKGRDIPHLRITDAGRVRAAAP